MPAFLVLKLQRTGSTMFGHVLDTHPSVSCTNEYLNCVKDRSRRTKVTTLADFYRSVPEDRSVGQTMNPFKYRLRPRDVARALVGGPSPVAARRPLPVHLVVLRRDDLLKQAVSAYQARRQGYESNRWALVDESTLSGQRFDLEELRRIVHQLDETRRRLDAFADRLRAERLEVSYEDLVADPEATFAAVFDHLGVEPPAPGFDYAGGYSKLHSDDLREVVANFDELTRDPVLGPHIRRS